MFGRSVPRERPDRPFTGFKLAHAVLSADGQRAGFTGLSIGARRVYGVSAEASCVWNRRHAPPIRRCGCGFYCLDSLAEANALSCATENRAAVLLEVVASGRFIRYERGLRYSRQRVRAVWLGACACGRPANGLVDAGTGVVGWRNLAAACPACYGERVCLTLQKFAALLDASVCVRSGLGADIAASANIATRADRSTGGDTGTGVDTAMPPDEPAGAGPIAASAIAILTAEIALVQARVDNLQAQVDRYHRGPDGPRDGPP